MTRNVLPAITSGAFVGKRESVAIIGDDAETYPFCESIAEACRNAGQSVFELDGEGEMVKVTSPAAVSDLLIVRQLPKDGEHQVGMGTAWSASKALGAILFKRAELCRSTLIVSCESPRDWALLNRLGPNTFWSAASLGIGLLLDSEDPDHDVYRNGIRVPAHHRTRALFEKYSVASMECIDQALLAEFDHDRCRANWHWVDYSHS